LRRNRHERALEAADQGLALDPEDVRCLNMRTEALARLGRKEDADRTIRKSLELDPENPFTHANTGWAVLRQGDHRKALEHFREALRRDPTNEYAKAGLVEALKARYWVYRVFLRYMLWAGSLTGRAQWILILGLYFGNRLLRGIAKSNPELAPLITPLLAAYFVFVLSTWIMVPLSNLFLRLNRYGRYALDREETMTSNFTGVALATSLIGGAAWLVTGLAGVLSLGIYGFVMMIPLASMLGGGKRGRTTLIGASILLAVLGAAGVLTAFRTGLALNGIFLVFLLGSFLYQWLANFVRIKS
jgi:Tfp pilus assembly protein PilF